MNPSRIYEDDLQLLRREQHIAEDRLHGLPGQPYEYTELQSGPKSKEIRLVELLPDDQKSHQIVCRIRLHNISIDAPTIAYEALSYTWGGTGSKDLRWIFVAVNDVFARLDVTDSLYAALWRLRYVDRSRLLWVDAISINQNDMAERSAQVEIMRDIYAQSAGVAIWLGEKTRWSEEALDLVQKINKVQRFDAAKEITRRLLMQSPKDNALPSAYNPIWHHFFDLLRRPWFKRAWIVQELATAPRATIYCATRQVSWTELHSAVLYMLQIAGSGLPAFGLAMPEIETLMALNRIREAFRDGKRPTALEMLIFNGQALASDMRDYLFAFYGLVPLDGGDRVTMKPKYITKLPEEGERASDVEYIQECVELYIERAKMLLHSHQNLDILSVSSVTQRLTDSNFPLPSWVPNWSVPAEQYFLLRPLLRSQFSPSQQPNYRASGNSTYTMTCAGRELLLKGHILDRISEVSKVNTALPALSAGRSTWYMLFQSRSNITHERVFQSMENVAGYWAGFFNREKYAPTGERKDKVYWQTIIGGLDGLVDFSSFSTSTNGENSTLR